MERNTSKSTSEIDAVDVPSENEDILDDLIFDQETAPTETETVNLVQEIRKYNWWNKDLSNAPKMNLLKAIMLKGMLFKRR